MDGLLKYTLIVFAVLTGLGILGALILGELPDSAIVVNPYYENVIYFCAYCFMALCGAGFFCIFIKRIRMAVGVAVGVLLLLFLNFACWNAILQNVSYRVARASTSVDREIVIAEKDNLATDVTLRFLQDGNDKTVPAEMPEFLINRLHEGDTCVAVVWDGLLGVKFISKIKNVRRKIEKLKS